MPYIKKDKREWLEMDNHALTPGELNYLITRLCLKYLGPKPGYSQYNDIVGALECAKLEFYRRKVSAYENEAMLRNGDVYEGGEEGNNS